MLYPRLIWLLGIVCTFFASQAQQGPLRAPSSTLRQHWISTAKDTVILDSLSIDPLTVVIKGVAPTDYHLNGVLAQLYWIRKPIFDSVWISYRVLPTRLNALTRHMLYDSVMFRFMAQPSIMEAGLGSGDDRFFDFGTLQYSGSFGRGLSFGNNQDAVLNSNLNLRLSGYIADSVEIMASIADNNLPIQPDGTTQQLNEFDQIYLRFSKKGTALSLGDIDLRQDKLYYMNFYKRLQGGSFETLTPLRGKAQNKLILSGSVAKGKYTRNLFQGQEGNQGPYRLQGANNELFFVVLANTERVYIDGELLQRGEDQDYIINYNTAEVVFMPKRMITKDKRIQVEFEYSDRNYMNINTYGFDELKIGEKATLRVGYFSNKDVKSSPIQQELNQDQRGFLATLGDQVQRALYPNATLDTFEVGKILYRKVDTSYNAGSQHDTVYVYSTNSSYQLYTLSFIDLGQGNGDYIPEFNGANGKVYRWVAPVQGVRQGRYGPVVYLVTPKKQQVASAGVDLKLGKTAFLQLEGAMSLYDVNLFSSKDKQNDRGFAAKMQFRDEYRFKSGERASRLVSSLGLETSDALFKPVERLRNVEFTRDWGLPLQVTPSAEQIFNAGLQWLKGTHHAIRYEIRRYQRGDGFVGNRHTMGQDQTFGTWALHNQLSYTNVSNTHQKGYFFRPSLQVTKEFPKLYHLSTTASFQQEQNAIRLRQSDSMALQSFSFTTFSWGIRSDASKQNRYGLTYFTRTDAYPIGKQLLKGDRSRNVQLQTELTKNEQHQFYISATYRTLEHLMQMQPTGARYDRSLLGRAKYDVNLYQGLLQGWLLYELGAGQEQKRDLAYLEVPAGQGEYTWNDYNADGIQQLNEFEVAMFRDQAKFIRIFTPTNEYVKARYNTVNYNVTLNPSAVMDPHTPQRLKGLLRKVQLQSSFQLNNKSENKGGLLWSNPFIAQVNDTALIALNAMLVNQLSINRSNIKWGVDFSNATNKAKMLLTYGYETRSTTEWLAKGRWSLDRKMLLDLSLRTGQHQLSTSNVNFGNRNYSIDFWSAEPRVNFTKGADFRWTLGYAITQKQNQGGDLEKALIHRLISETKYNVLQRSAIQGKLTLSDIQFQSAAAQLKTQSPAAYLMLDGLLPGKNILWTIDLNHQLSKSLELNIQYEGRKPGTGRVVHIGRASIRAIL